MKKARKKILVYAGIIAAFLVISYGFVPDVLGGKIVNQSDITGYVGMAHEANSWNDAHPGDRTAWTGSMFGGMPTTMLTGNPSGDATQGIFDAFLVGKRPANYLFISLLGAFLLMLALSVHPLLAAAGAVAVTFCSYNMQIIQVGHNAKMLALAWCPWVLAAVIYSYRKALGMYGGGEPEGRIPRIVGLLAGPVLTGLALSFQIKANHVQISYYLAIIIVSYVLVNFVWIMFRRKELVKKFLTTSALLVVFAIVGIATNANRLLPTWEYTQETMRGGSSLSRDDGGKSKGLSFEYATQWSYGTEELPNLLIPNFNGGASAGAVNPDKSATIKLLKEYGQTNTAEIAKALPMYWGPQPFTAGPMYIGAITVFLFLLGLGLLKRRERWWLLIPTVLGILLALGGTYGRTDLFSSVFRGFNRFWFDNMPFYSKFRTVSMALVILQFTLPMLGFVALDRVLKRKIEKKTVLRVLVITTAVSGGLCLLCWLFPGIVGSFSSPSDSGYDPRLAAAFAKDRIMLMRSDALVSLLLIMASAALVWWMYKARNEAQRGSRSLLCGSGICIMLILNLFLVGKRYLNSSHFVTQSRFDSHFTERPADKFIHADADLSYRVVDLSTDVFNDATPSYHHKNIGGYSPVKLQRYQDLIDRYLRDELSSIVRTIGGAETLQEAQEKLDSAAALPIFSALNGRYIIVDGSVPPLVNDRALGNAWFVDSCVVAKSPDEEISLIGSLDLARTAVLGKEISPLRPSASGRNDSESSEPIPVMSSEPISVMSSEAETSQTEHLAMSSEALPVMSSEVETSQTEHLAMSSEPISVMSSEVETSQTEHLAMSNKAIPVMSSEAETSHIELTFYAPNRLEYNYNATNDALAVFSEVWCDYGWTAWIEDSAGNKTADIDLIKADWTLRAAVLPAGEHKVVMRFQPASYTKGSAIASASSWLLILLVLAVALSPLAAGKFLKKK